MGKDIDSKQHYLLNLIEKKFKSDQEKINELKEELEEARENIIDLENSNQDEGIDLPAETLLGEQKNEILLKLRHLDLEILLKLEAKYCQNISEYSQITD
jgi:uncharacterized protein involved in exopolysaccharide biosynthesis